MQNVAAEPAIWQSDLLATIPRVRHAVTGRASGLGLADGNIGFSPPRDKADAWAMREHWCGLAGLDARQLVTLGQIHGAVHHRVRREDAGRGAQPAAQKKRKAGVVAWPSPSIAATPSFGRSDVSS